MLKIEQLAKQYCEVSEEIAKLSQSHLLHRDGSTIWNINIMFDGPTPYIRLCSTTNGASDFVDLSIPAAEALYNYLHKILEKERKSFEKLTEFFQNDNIKNVTYGPNIENNVR